MGLGSLKASESTRLQFESEISWLGTGGVTVKIDFPSSSGNRTQLALIYENFIN